MYPIGTEIIGLTAFAEMNRLTLVEAVEAAIAQHHLSCYGNPIEPGGIHELDLELALEILAEDPTLLYVE